MIPHARRYLKVAVSIALIVIVVYVFMMFVVDKTRPALVKIAKSTTSAPFSGCRRKFVSYESSKLEQKWLSRMADPKENREWITDPCKFIHADAKTFVEWLNAIEYPDKEANKKILQSLSIFSRFVFQFECADTTDPRHLVRFEESIEPLAGVLRDPRGPCGNQALGLAQNDIGSLAFLVLPKNDHGVLSVSLFDFGASLWEAGLGRASQNWFYDYFNRQTNGYIVDRFYMFEATLHKPIEIFQPVPKKLLPRYNYYNVPISAVESDKMHAWTFVQDAPRSDYVIVKLDIDTPSVEGPLVKQLVEQSKYHSLVDEFFFEHHVAYRAMSLWWGQAVQGTLADSYKLYHTLRMAGVRAHAWP